jgi:hypothetical protein
VNSAEVGSGSQHSHPDVGATNSGSVAMPPMGLRTVSFRPHPELYSRQLGRDLYRSPVHALRELVANCLDADCTTITIDVQYNDLDTPSAVSISDDGHGMSPSELELAFGVVGKHVDVGRPGRRTIGSRGIGRFAVHALAVDSVWETVGKSGGECVRQTWRMRSGDADMKVSTEAATGSPTGTTIHLTLIDEQTVARLFLNPASVKRALFNYFASYLLLHEGQITVRVNGDVLRIADYVDQREREIIEQSEMCPAATVHHLSRSR